MSGRRTLLSLATAALTVSAIALAGAPAQASAFSNINVVNSSHCLDNATDNSAKLQMWRCDSGSDEQWLTESTGAGYRFVNQDTGWCITAAPGIGAGAITMSPCQPFMSTQLWSPFESRDSGVKMWQSAASQLCLTTPSVANGTVPRTETCDVFDQYDWWQQQ